EAGGVDAVCIRHLATALAILRIIGVAQDGDEPGAHIGAGDEAPRIAPSLQHGFLQEIVGLVERARKRHREGPQILHLADETLAELFRPRFGSRRLIRHGARSRASNSASSTSNRSGRGISAMAWKWRCKARPTASTTRGLNWAAPSSASSHSC